MSTASGRSRSSSSPEVGVDGGAGGERLLRLVRNVLGGGAVGVAERDEIERAEDAAVLDLTVQVTQAHAAATDLRYANTGHLVLLGAAAPCESYTKPTEPSARSGVSRSRGTYGYFATASSSSSRPRPGASGTGRYPSLGTNAGERDVVPVVDAVLQDEEVGYRRAELHVRRQEYRAAGVVRRHGGVVTPPRCLPPSCTA